MILLSRGIFLLTILCLPVAAVSQQSDSLQSQAGIITNTEVPDNPDSFAALQNPVRNRFWISLGMGSGTRGLATTSDATFQIGSMMLSLRSVWMGSVHSVIYEDYGLLYGWATTANAFHLSFSSGIALMQGDRYYYSDTWQKIREGIPLRFSLPLMAQIKLTSRRLGTGMNLFVNLNGVESFGGVSLAFNFGRLR
jgi:hypothetical protein